METAMRKKIAVLATASSSGELGGAERFYQGLCDALCAHGMAAEIVSVVSDESDFCSILRSYLRFYDLDLSMYDGVISTKAPGYLARHRNHVCYLQHTMRVFYDMFDVEFPWAGPELAEQRRRILEMDTAALSSPNIKRVFAIGDEVRKRLLEFNGVDSTVLYQATTMGGFRTGGFDYLFMPGRLHRWKRVNLVIQAMALAKAPVELLVSGVGEDEAELRLLSAGNKRIHFLGRISDTELLEHYANALAIPFVPIREDFGLVAIEAFHSGKPVITCSDSGEPARLVSAFEAGMVCAPTPVALAEAIDTLHADPVLARRMGEKGRAGVAEMGWAPTAKALIEALGFGE